MANVFLSDGQVEFSIHLKKPLSEKATFVPESQNAPIMFDKLQSEQEEIKKALAMASVEVQSGNGLVTLKMSGDRRVTGLTIQSDHPDHGDTDHLEDHLVLAMNDALEQVAQLEQKTMQEWMGRLLPGGLGGLKGIFGG